MTAKISPAALVLGFAFVIAGCEPGVNADGTPKDGPFSGLFGSKEEPKDEASADGVVTYIGENRDVQAPDIFQVSDKGLWDGRPSLGGAWVAHPDVKDPQRVLIVNEANGKTITAALFRRERDNPGPAFQLSSDAAGDLSVVPGRPIDLKVTALRKAPEPETVPEAGPEATPEIGQDSTPAAQDPSPEQTATSQASITPAEIEENTLNTVAAAEAALDRSEAGDSGVGQ